MIGIGSFQKMLDLVGGVRSKRNPVTGGIDILVDGVTYPLAGSEPDPEFQAHHRWVAGDFGATEALAVSGVYTSHPVDARNISLADATLQVVIAGSGTVKVDVSGSVDGLTFLALPTQLSGLTVGSSILKLRASTMQDWPFYKFTFTETGGASTATVKAAILSHDAAETVDAYAGFVNRFTLGDESVGVAVATSAAITAAPCDMRNIKRDAASVAVKITGSGTAKLTISGSMDGLSNWHSLGDRITGMTAGAYSLALSDSNLAYFPFYRFVVTETGGASPVVATVSVAGRQPIAYSEKPRVLLLADSEWVQGADWTVTWDDSYRHSVALLEKMGYAVDFRAIDDIPSTFLDSLVGTYDFIFLPNTRGAYWSTWTSGAGRAIGRLLKGQCKIPVIAVGIDQSSNAQLLAAVGAGVMTASASRKVLWRGAPWYMASGVFATVTQQAHMTGLASIVTDAATGGAVAWRFTGANGAVYASAGAVTGGDNIALPIMLAEAVIAGHIPAPPKKLRAVIDIDDMPDCGGGGQNGTQTLSDIERVYAAMQRLNMPCSFGIRPEDIAGGKVSQLILSYFRSRTADNGGLIYPIAHSGLWFWKDGDKATKHAAYAANIATITAAGLKIGRVNQYDAWGYSYFNNNAFDEETLQLASPEICMAASTASATRQAGYGWAVVRSDAIGGNNTEPVGANSLGSFGKTVHRGIRVVGSFNHMSATQKSLDPDDGAAGTAVFALQCERLFSRAVAWDSPMYIHGSNCYDGHDSGNAPGTVWLEILAGAMEAGMSNVLEFVHGSALADA